MKVTKKDERLRIISSSNGFSIYNPYAGFILSDKFELYSAHFLKLNYYTYNIL